MTTNQETINSIANAIVCALTERLLSEDAFISALAERVCKTDDATVDKRIEMALAEFIDGQELDRKIVEVVEGVDLDEKVDHRVEKYFQSYEVDAENVSGLEDLVDDRVERALHDHEVEADDVSGLDQAVTSALDDVLEDKVVSIITGGKIVISSVLETR